MGRPVAIFWYRRDLRLDDNAGLHAALTSGREVLPLFVFDRHILDVLEDRDDARVTFLHRVVSGLRDRFAQRGCAMEVHYGTPEKVFAALSRKHEIAAVYTNRDYEPYAEQRDAAVRQVLAEAYPGREVPFETRKDHVIFESDEVQKKTGGAYTVFTPYSRRWQEVLTERMDEDGNGEAVSYYLKSYPIEAHLDALRAGGDAVPMPSLAEMGFSESELDYPPPQPSESVIERYDETRDYPAIPGTTQMGVHLRHGTVSIRRLARRAQDLNAVYLSELIWRDFYSGVLQSFPHVVTESYRPEYDHIEWANDEEHFEAWCAGRTGYPLVDAGMRELNATGYMHNRVRMVTASFLTKHLLTDWRWGERYFARKLLDYDLASNNGGWQWAAGTGADASPYFRVFNPESQLKKFDRKLEYVRRWVPEYGTDEYPEPIVEHRWARERAIDRYKAGLAEARGA